MKGCTISVMLLRSFDEVEVDALCVIVSLSTSSGAYNRPRLFDLWFLSNRSASGLILTPGNSSVTAC